MSMTRLQISQTKQSFCSAMNYKLKWKFEMPTVWSQIRYLWMRCESKCSYSWGNIDPDGPLEPWQLEGIDRYQIPPWQSNWHLPRVPSVTKYSMLIGNTSTWIQEIPQMRKKLFQEFEFLTSPLKYFFSTKKDWIKSNASLS